MTAKITQHTLNRMVEVLGPPEDFPLAQTRENTLPGFIEVDGREVSKRIAYTAEVNRINDKLEWVILKMQILEE